MDLLTAAEIQGVLGALVRARRADVASRTLLLARVEPSIACNLPAQHSVIGQLLSDLTELNRLDRTALTAWLRQAVLMTEHTAEADILRRALEKVAGTGPADKVVAA